MQLDRHRPSPALLASSRSTLSPFRGAREARLLLRHCTCPISLFKKANAPQPVLFVRRRVRLSSRVALRSDKSEGARDTGVLGDPRTSISRDIEAVRMFSTASPPFPRRPARGVWRLAPQNPRWAYFSGLREVSPLAGNLPTAVGANGCTFGLAPLRIDRQNPVTRSSRAGTLRLGPPTGGVRLAPLHSHPPATALPSRLTTPHEAPSDGQAWAPP